jgi:hypothetical protein
MADNNQLKTARLTVDDAVVATVQSFADLEQVIRLITGYAADTDIQVSPFNINNATGAVEVNVTLQLLNGVAVNSILDEDDLASNSATAVPTQQSVKAYVDGADEHGFAVGYQPAMSETIVSGGWVALGLFIEENTAGWTYGVDYIQVPPGRYIISAGVTFEPNVSGNTRSVRIGGIRSGLSWIYIESAGGTSTGPSLSVTGTEIIASGTAQIQTLVYHDAVTSLDVGGYLSIVRLGPP